ncbi:MAG: CHASE3 domain-containing protein, partial [Pseudomonadota bacterium]|nr:CHASE3 domain-containing protein [Pseudomonadota bacterium]
MKLPSSQSWSRFGDFVRTPSLARSVTGLLVLAFVLLLTVNISTFVMIQRTAAVNDAIEHAQQMRRQSRSVLIAMLNAETAQRGFLLTGRSDFLTPFEETRAAREPALAFLEEGAAADPTLRASVAQIRRLSDAKLREMEATLALAREGRIGQAIQTVRSGEGKRYMDELRQTIDDFDAFKSARIAERTRVSERAAMMTVVMNAITGLLVLVLALLSAWMVRRYVGEIQHAREEVA